MDELPSFVAEHGAALAIDPYDRPLPSPHLGQIRCVRRAKTVADEMERHIEGLPPPTMATSTSRSTLRGAR